MQWRMLTNIICVLSYLYEEGLLSKVARVEGSDIRLTLLTGTYSGLATATVHNYVS